jgi:o-succinylbenzoate synthase
LKTSLKKHKLLFRFDAGTSRGILTSRDTWLLKIWDEKQASVFGLGEAAPLKGLSPDDRPDFEEKFLAVCEILESIGTSEKEISRFLKNEDNGLKDFPAIHFGIETAARDFFSGGKRILFDTSFSRGDAGIPINGLVWMGNKEFMREQIFQKLQSGYSCIKIKVGAIDFDSECAMLEEIRKTNQKVEIRLDANGAFDPSLAMEKLNILSRFAIHSIEQPIKQGNAEVMAELCARSPIPIALDEELIGIWTEKEKLKILKSIKPQYIILKPTLIGGLHSSLEWIQIARSLNIGWWLTSALESNIGLNAISQFASSLELGEMPQGLGTGQLYLNNIKSPLVIFSGNLRYEQSETWDFSMIS